MENSAQTIQIGDIARKESRKRKMVKIKDKIHPADFFPSTQDDDTNKIRRKQALKKPNTQISASDIFIRRSTNSKVLVKRAESILFPSFEKQGNFELSVSDLIETYAKRSSAQRFPNPVDDKLIPGRFITIHAVGAAIPKAILVSSEIMGRHPNTLTINVVTSTEIAIDQIEDLETFDIEEEERKKAAIHIKLSIKDS